MIEKISLDIAIGQLKRLPSGNSGIRSSKDIAGFIERLSLPDLIKNSIKSRIMPMGIESPDEPLGQPDHQRGHLTSNRRD